MPIQIPGRRVSTLEKIAQAVGIAKDILSTGASVYGAVQEGKQTEIKQKSAKSASKLAALKYKNEIAQQQVENEQKALEPAIIPAKELKDWEIKPFTPNKAPPEGYSVQFRRDVVDNKVVTSPFFGKPREKPESALDTIAKGLAIQSAGLGIKVKEDELKNPKYTDKQSNSAAYAIDAIRAEQSVRNLAESKYNRAGKLSSFAAGITNADPFGIGESFKSDELKQEEKAERDFVNSVARGETGATIKDDEMDTYTARYFPRSGDSKEQIKRKEQSRIDKIRTLAVLGGRAFNDVVSKIPDINKETLGEMGLDDILTQGSKATTDAASEKISKFMKNNPNIKDPKEAERILKQQGFL